MIVLTLAEVAALTGARLTGGADGTAPVTGDVVTDSRRVAPGDLFVALAGERADGHDHALAALAAGAVAVLAGREVGGPALVVDDPLAALGRLARGVVDRIGPLTVVGVTGSSGKTSTKDLIAAVLDAAGPVVATAGSFNNELGLPLTALRCAPATRWLVAEMGARMPGNISYLCGITPPRVAVVVNVGTAHAGVFGSVDATARTKAELIAALPPGGVAVLNADDARVAAMPVPAGARTVRYGLAPGERLDVAAEDVRLDAAARASFRLRTPAGSADVALRLHGAHHVGNALAAAAVGLEAGLDPAGIARTLSGAGTVSHWRMEVTTRADGVTVVNDAYNANPESVRAALEALAVMARGPAPREAGDPGDPGDPGGTTAPRRSWAVLGEMLELGEAATAAHTEMGRTAGRLRVDRLVVVGERAAAAVRAGALEAGMPPDAVTTVADRDAAGRELAAGLAAGDVVLVKASNSVGLFVLADELLGGALVPGEAHR